MAVNWRSLPLGNQNCGMVWDATKVKKQGVRKGKIFDNSLAPNPLFADLRSRRIALVTRISNEARHGQYASAMLNARNNRSCQTMINYI